MILKSYGELGLGRPRKDGFHSDFEICSRTESTLLSTPFDLRLPLRWMPFCTVSSKPIWPIREGSNHEAVIKALMVGAQVTMMASTLMERGIDHAHQVL